MTARDVVLMESSSESHRVRAATSAGRYKKAGNVHDGLCFVGRAGVVKRDARTRSICGTSTSDLI